jgi:hypothetical protein
MASQLHSTTYRCLHCRLAQRAEVRSSRAITATQLRGVPRMEANAKVAMLLALKRCPRCGYFDRSVAKHNRYNLRFAQIASTSLFAIAVLVLFAIPGPWQVFAASAGVLGLVWLLLMRRLSARYPLSVESSVVLTEPTPMAAAWY